MSSWQEWTCGENPFRVDEELVVFSASAINPANFVTTTGFIRCCLQTDNSRRLARTGARYDPDRVTLSIYVNGRKEAVGPMPETKEALMDWIRMVEAISRE